MKGVSGQRGRNAPFFEALEPRRLLAATRLLDLLPDNTNLTPNGGALDVNGVLYFTADDGRHGLELWRTDGTPGGTRLVCDINPGSAGSGPQFLTNVNETRGALGMRKI